MSTFAAPFPEPDRADFVEVNRTRLRTWAWGDPADPPVVLAHGGHDHGRMWDDFAPRLAALGLHVVAIDARGHGDSGRLSSGLMWTAATIDLCELARLLAPAPGVPVGMIGHSMGAGQVMSAAATAPERIGWVVNLDGLGPPADAFAETDLVEAATRSVDAIVAQRNRPQKVWASREAMADRRGSVNVRLPRRFLDHLIAHGTVETEGGYVWKSDPLLNLGIPDGFSVDMIKASYADISAPVLALTSSEDDAWTELDDDEAQRRVGLLRDARWRSVPDAGHYVHVEQPDFVLAEIAAFLTELGVIRQDAS